MIYKGTRILIAAGAMGLAACTNMPPQNPGDSYPAPQSTYPGYPQSTYPGSPQSTYPGPQAYASYGYVESVEVVPATRQGPGVGAIGGAVAGGVLGSRIGHGDGRILGAVGGAVVGSILGNEIEKRTNPAHPAQYRYRVRMDDGSYQTFSQEADANVRAGDRVRVENGRVWGS